MLILTLLFESCSSSQLLRLRHAAHDHHRNSSGRLLDSHADNTASSQQTDLADAIDAMLSGRDIAFLGSGAFADDIYAQCEQVIPQKWLSDWGGVSPDLYKGHSCYTGVLVAEDGIWFGLGRELSTVSAELAVSLFGHFQPPEEALVGDCPFAKHLSTIPFLEMVRDAMGESGKLLVNIG